MHAVVYVDAEVKEVTTGDDIRAIADVFDRVGAAATEEHVAHMLDVEAPGSLASGYFALLKNLDGSNVPVAMREIGFFRFFVANSLLQAQRLRHDMRSFVLRAIAAGLREFAAYFAFLEKRSAETAYPEIERDEKRYYAFCIAQLIEIGFEMDGLLMTMKGDAYDQSNAYELRRLREDGPDAFAATWLFDDHEKALWNAVFDKGGAPAINALQQHFVTTYKVPFIAAPEA